MLDIDNKDFDSQIRSVFSDAEEKVPRSVWNVVRSELDAALVARNRILEWTGLAFAVAAVLAGAVLLIDRSSPDEVSPTSQKLSAKVIVVPDSPDETISSEEATATTPVRRKPAYLAQDIPAAREAERERILSKDTPVSADEIHPDKPQAEYKEPEGLVVEDWLDDDIPQAGRRVSITVNSSIGGNDKDFSSVFRPKKTAPGISFKNRDYILESGSSNYSIPFSAGLGVRVTLGSKFSVGSGASYSYLARTFFGVYYDESGKSSGEVQIGHYMHYVGIPVNAFYDLVSGRRLKFYVYAGGQVDFCLSNKYQVYGNTPATLSNPVSTAQWSVGAGLGVEFLLVDKFGIYFDPGARYYFPCEQPKNIHTERPFNINFDIGFRYDF